MEACSQKAAEVAAAVASHSYTDLNDFAEHLATEVLVDSQKQACTSQQGQKGYCQSHDSVSLLSPLSPSESEQASNFSLPAKSFSV